MTLSEHNAPIFGGAPSQMTLVSSRARLADGYLLIPNGSLRDIVSSRLPHWSGTRLWILARPQSGLAETFSQYLMEVEPGGGSTRPEPDVNAEAVLYVLSGVLSLTVGDEQYRLDSGGYAYLPPGVAWSVQVSGSDIARFHWIRKSYEWSDEAAPPPVVISHERDAELWVMPQSDGRWRTLRFVDPDDMRYDMHVNIVEFDPGAVISLTETHVMEHGVYVLEGKAVYRLNDDWIEVTAGDFIVLRAFCPQTCYAGPTGLRYLLYKDVNRHARLTTMLSKF